MMYCSKCGSDLRGNKSRCPTCGYSFDQMKRDDSQIKIGYKHSEFNKDPPKAVLKRDEYGEPILPYSDEWRKAKEEKEKPRTLTFKKPDEAI